MIVERLPDRIDIEVDLHHKVQAVAINGVSVRGLRQCWTTHHGHGTNVHLVLSNAAVHVHKPAEWPWLAAFKRRLVGR